MPSAPPDPGSPVDPGGGVSPYAGAQGGLRVVMASISGYTAKQLLPQPFLFQCPPLDNFTAGYAHSHTDYETLTLGQLSRPGRPQLDTVTFDTLVVDYKPVWAFRTASPQEHAKALKEILKSGTPFRLVAWDADRQATSAVDMYATLRTMQVAERSGEPDARYLNVAFTQFKSEGLSLTSWSGTQTVTRSVSTLPEGMRTVADLSKVYYGSPGAYAGIRAANPQLGRVGNNEDLTVVFASDPLAQITIPGAEL